MSEPCVIRTLAELQAFDISSLPARPEPGRVLMCTPEAFDVVDVKNAFMAGHVGTVDKAAARAEWESLRKAFEKAGHEVVTIEGGAGLEDMVFCANQVLPGTDSGGQPYVVLSHMRHESRRREVPLFREWFAGRGYRIVELPDDTGFFEGQGDAIWHPGRSLIWGGVGQRTSLDAYTAVSRATGAPVVALDLVHPSFYHLDTAFCALSPDAVLVYPPAFTDEGRAMIAHGFKRVIEVEDADASEHFACNAAALDGRTVIIQRGAGATVAKLRAEGFDVIEVETGEFIKSGGSVFCMKMMIY
ncbi:MAG TPA: arginine deiminase-related protein [Blastocatellia bacterium]|nr:arginine deiminase-related protein [Blastocatellia bacterium]